MLKSCARSSPIILRRATWYNGGVPAVTLNIIAPCPKCKTEAHLSHPATDGEILLTPPFWLLQCANPYCRVVFRATLRVDCETWPPKNAEYPPMKLAE
jgi:hypothetical protein